VNVAVPKRNYVVEEQRSNEDSGTFVNAPASTLSQVEAKEDQSHPSIGSASQEELQLKQQVAKRVEKEVALILENELELDKIKREAEEKIKILNETIRTRKSKVEILMELFEY